MVTKTDWGMKRTCPKCGSRFYDLGKNPATCPKCGTEFDATIVQKPKRGRGKAAHSNIEPDAKKEAKQKAKKPVKEIEDIDLEEFEDIETLDSEEEIEELEEMEDVESLDELEKADDGKPGDDEAVIDEIMIDGLDEDVVEVIEEDDEEADTKPKRPAGKGNKKK